MTTTRLPNFYNSKSDFQVLFGLSHDETKEETRFLQSNSDKGFAALDEEKQGQIASKEGQTSNNKTDDETEDEDQEQKANNKSKRGFASMDPEKQRRIASKGGQAAHQKGTAHKFTPEEAREAGRKGGSATLKK